MLAPISISSSYRPADSKSAIDPTLASKNKARCIVTDIYIGMEGVERGTVKYLRIMEQVPRPWTARTRWWGDGDGFAHTTISATHLALKLQYGIVPVEKDGSAYFEVPANRNIYFQALDKNYMAVQTERTYVNYMPGETRSCLGCHETPQMAATEPQNKTPLALMRAPSTPTAQPDGLPAKEYSTIPVKFNRS